jgi:uncharacterized protein YjbJ (UPF0337 family)
MTTNSSAEWRGEDREWAPPASPERLDIPEVAPEDAVQDDDRDRGNVGLDDKIKDSVKEAVGKAKEALGKVTDNEDLQAEGRAEQLPPSRGEGVRGRDTFRE